MTLWLTAAFSADMTRASSEHLQANLTWLAGEPILQTAPGPFRLGYSYLDADVLLSDEHALVVDAVEDIVLSSQYRVGRVRTDDQELMARWSRRINDVQHLAAHHMTGHDAFVTSDYDDIVSKREQLWERARIRVYTPDEAVQAIDPQ